MQYWGTRLHEEGSSFQLPPKSLPVDRVAVGAVSGPNDELAHLKDTGNIDEVRDLNVTDDFGSLILLLL